MAYTEEDKKAFAEKDARISRTAGLNNATKVIVAAAEIANDATPLNVKTIMETASRFVEYIYGGPVETTDTPPETLPTPTVKQKAVIDAVVKKTSIEEDLVKEYLLTWAEQVHKVRKYPENLSSVDTFIAWRSK